MTQELWDGRYRIERILGEGGMGQVVMARDTAQGDRYVAVKLLSPDHRDHTTDFMREYSVQRSLNHPAIPLVHAFGFGLRNKREVPYFVMDYVSGVPLANALMTLTDPSDAWPWVVQVLRGLDHTHRAGFLHRDLKPGNIIVTQRQIDDDNAASLIDFGIAIPFEEPPEALFIGTPEYSAPDLMAGAPFEVRQDLYAIGLLLYEVLTGRRPWPGDDPTDLYHKRMYTPYPPISSPHCTPALDRLIADLLHPRPDHRPGSAAEVIERLTDAVRRPASVETAQAFYRRLLAQPFEMASAIRTAADAWLGRTRPSQPVLVLENPPGWDGPSIAHGLADEAAVGGARIIRYALERRRHRALEAIRPALDVLRALRAERTQDDLLFADGQRDTMRDLASAATLLSRIEGPTVIAIDHLEWADAPSLELIVAVLTGARNPGLRIITTWDPTVPSHARHALDRLLAMDGAVSVGREPLSLEEVTDWTDLALGAEAIPDVGILSLHDRAGGRPERVRALLAEEMRRGALVRTAAGFSWRGQPPRANAEALPTRSREALVSLAAEIDLPLPEAVVALYLELPHAELLRLVDEGILAVDAPGTFVGHEDVRAWLLTGQTGGAREARERLARSVELAVPFPGQSERAAREWLRAARPLKAAPCLLAAAQDALATGLRNQGDGGLRAAQLLESAGRVLDRQRTEPLEPAEREAMESLDRELGRASIRLARARGRHDEWARAAEDLLARGMNAGHHATIEVALEALAQLSLDLGDIAALRRHVEAVRAAPLGGAASLAQWALGAIDAHEGRTDAALKRLSAIPRENLDSRRQLLIALKEAEVALGGARLEAAERALSRAYAHAERSRDERGVFNVLLGRVRLTRLQHRAGRARELADDLARQLGDRQTYRLDGQLALEQSRILCDLGRAESAIVASDRAESFATRDGDADTLGSARVARARAHGLLGAIDTCATTLKQAMALGLLTLGRQVRRETELGVIEAALLHALTLRGDRGTAERDRAIRTLRDLAEAAELEGYRDIVARSLVVAIEGALAGRDPALARQMLKELEGRLNRWGEVGVPWHVCWYLQSEALRQAGETEAAERPLRLARTAVKRLAGLISRDEDRKAWLAAAAQRRVLLPTHDAAH